jgi:hypothetical protein
MSHKIHVCGGRVAGRHKLSVYGDRFIMMHGNAFPNMHASIEKMKTFQ